MNYILGIETSCDETAMAIYTDQGLIAHTVYSQLTHEAYGGVVPEIAAREHLMRLQPIFEQTLAEANITPSDLTHIACTSGPGLIGALLVGCRFAQGLSLGLKIPLIPINHLEAHVAAPFINQAFPEKPFLTLLVSGGHTQIIHTKQLGEYELLGETLDDAAGEAFDKTAKVLGLGYPGGPEIEQLANTTDAYVSLPKALIRRKDAMMSFSGIKTAAKQYFESNPDQPNIKAEIANGLQHCIAEQLCRKLNHAITQTGTTHVVISGGVSANTFIREQLKHTQATTVDFPALKYCTDNAAMVAYLGYLRRYDQHPLELQSRWSLTSLNPPSDL